MMKKKKITAKKLKKAILKSPKLAGINKKELSKHLIICI
jgi:hypothetical protein